MKLALKILFFPVTWPFLLNKWLAETSRSRIAHWLLNNLITSFSIPIITILVMGYLFLNGTITAETDFETWTMPSGAKLTICIGMAYFYFVSFFGPWLPGSAAIHRERNRAKTHGDARFSTTDEVVEKGLVGSGIVFGRLNRKLIEKPPTVDGNILIAGAPGTGKSTAVAIPTLFRFNGGAFVIDIKGELSELTAQHRKQYGPIYIFDPVNGGHCYDPIRECKTTNKAQNLARALVPTPEKGDPMWSSNAQAILAAAIIEAAHTGNKLSEVAERCVMTPPTQLIQELQESPVRAARILSAVGNMPEKTLGGVMAQLRSGLFTLAADEGIAEATSRSDFTPASLEEGATIYLRVPEEMIAQYRELWTVMVSQFMQHLESREKGASPHILLQLDEMPRLGHLPGITESLAMLRSRNVTIMLLIQSIAQLDLIYGSETRKVIADTCDFKFVLSAGDPETQRYFSDLAGQATVHSKSVTVGAGWIPNMGRSETGVPLIRPEVWARLPKPILLARGIQPTALDPAYWFSDKEFKHLALPSTKG